MFSSSKITESPRLQKFSTHSGHQTSSINDSAGGIYRHFQTPKITSTPVRLDTYATPPKPHLLSPRRLVLNRCLIFNLKRARVSFYSGAPKE